MDKSNIGVAHALSGELTTDYFYFYCTMCGNRISHVVFYGVDSVGVKLLARCETCDFSYIFKVKSKPKAQYK
jgi:transcription elongation factor Elf1